MTEKEQLQVEAIKNGTVIDHIPAGQALNILKHFHILDNNDRITVDIRILLRLKMFVLLKNRQIS